MSNLLEQASLVMIPSGYKEDVVYSEIPINGAGDLSFTRASNGTRVNSAGLVEVVPWNLLGYSEQFDNGFWVKQSATVTANSTTAPNGTLTADTFNVTATAYSSIYNAGTLSLSLGIYTQGIYAKKGTKNYLYILDLTATSAKAWFNLDTGVVGTVASGYTATMESVGNGWYRCSLSQNTSVTPSYFHFGASDSDNSFTPSSSGNIYIWGAQLNIGSTAKPYFPTTDRLNVPRLTYQNGGGGCPSLLLEKQSTNLVLYSQDFDNAAWAKPVSTITANDIISPDGTQNADRLNAVSSSGIYQLVTTATGIYTQTIYVKQGTNRYFGMSITSTATNRYVVYFDLQAGTVYQVYNTSTPLTNTSNSITAVGNGWYRCQVTGSCSGDIYAVYQCTNTTPLTLDAVGDLTNGSNGTVYLWGAQLEQSSYPTSYIPTTSSSATRVADACSKTGISSLIGQTEGTMFCDVNLNVRTAFTYFVINNGGSSSQYIGFYFRTNAIELEVVNSGLQASIVLASTSTGRFKVAASYKANDFVLYINGTQIGTDTSGTVPTCNKLDLFGYSQEQPIEYNQAILFPTRLTNAELASLTTI